MSKQNSLYVGGENIVIYDSMDDISNCLNCPLPASKCKGAGNCRIDKMEHKEYRNIAEEVRQHVLNGLKRAEIAQLCGINLHSVSVYIHTDVKRGILTQEQADNSRSRNYCMQG